MLFSRNLVIKSFFPIGNFSFNIIFDLFIEEIFFCLCSEDISGPVNTPCEPPQTVERDGGFFGHGACLVAEPR